VLFGAVPHIVVVKCFSQGKGTTLQRDKHGDAAFLKVFNDLSRLLYVLRRERPVENGNYRLFSLFPDINQ